MTMDERKTSLTRLVDQTKATLLTLNEQNAVSKDTILAFDDLTLDLVNAVVDSTQANELTLAPSTTSPAPSTTKTESPSTDKPDAPANGTTSSTLSSTASETPAPSEDDMITMSMSDSADTDIESPDVTTDAGPAPSSSKPSAMRVVVLPVAAALVTLVAMQ